MCIWLSNHQVSTKGWPPQFSTYRCESLWQYELKEQCKHLNNYMTMLLERIQGFLELYILLAISPSIHKFAHKGLLPISEYVVFVHSFLVGILVGHHCQDLVVCLAY